MEKARVILERDLARQEAHRKTELAFYGMSASRHQAQVYTALPRRLSRAGGNLCFRARKGVDLKRSLHIRFPPRRESTMLTPLLLPRSACFLLLRCSLRRRSPPHESAGRSRPPKLPRGAASCLSGRPRCPSLQRPHRPTSTWPPLPRRGNRDRALARTRRGQGSSPCLPRPRPLQRCSSSRGAAASHAPRARRIRGSARTLTPLAHRRRVRARAGPTTLATTAAPLPLEAKTTWTGSWLGPFSAVSRAR